MNDDEIDRMLEEHRFPLGDPLGDSAFRCHEHLMGDHKQQLYLGRRTHGSDDRFLITVMWAPDAPVDQLRRDLAYRAPGVLELEFLGHFDRLGGGNPDRDLLREAHCALVEKLPAKGEWLPRRLTRPLDPWRAALLGASVGDILLRVAEGGLLLVGVRPEYLWIDLDGDLPAATGLTGRNYDFFAHTGGPIVLGGALFPRYYYAPEVYLGKAEVEQSLVFTLAIMVAEWATGAYPFPDSWASGNMHSLCKGRHIPLEVPAPLDQVLVRSLLEEPALRPTLAAMIRDLRAAAKRV
jgi:hypothetical protein